MKEKAMYINDEEAYDRKMEDIIVSLEVFILDVLGAAVKRLLANNGDFLKDTPPQHLDDNF